MIFDDEFTNKQEFEFEREAIYRKKKIRTNKDSHSLTNDRLLSDVSDTSSRK
jgi:hypothetical protein